ncbi:MAG: serine hydrolase domain-containing protein [Bacteroidota bacterium]
MINKGIVFIVTAFSLFACQNDPPEGQEKLAEAKVVKIDSLANRYLELGRFSGAIAVAKGESVFYQNYFGLADYENNQSFSDRTAFKVGVVSELATANIIRRMVDDEKISLTDSISAYIPAINASFTVGDLLNHQANLSSIQSIQESNPEVEYSTVTYANLALNSTETSERSDLGYNILGLLIEEVSGQNFQANVEQYAQELGLVNTYFQTEDSIAAVGYLYNNYRGNGMELHKSPDYNLDIAFSSGGIKSTTKDVVKIINDTPEKAVELDGYLPNDGFSYAISGSAASDTTIVVLSNRRHPVAREITTSVRAILQDEGYQLPLLREPVAIDSAVLKSYAGTYAMNENMSFTVINENDSLFVLMGPNRIPVIPQSDNQFYMEQNDAAMRFLRDDSNAVTGVMLLDGFLDGNIAKKVEE